MIPSTLAQVTLAAEVLAPEPAGGGPGANGHGAHRLIQVRGESNIGHSEGRIQRVYLQPEDAPAYPKAIRAMLDADLIVIGPGSLYTSVLPNLLVPRPARCARVGRGAKSVCVQRRHPGGRNGGL